MPTDDGFDDRDLQRAFTALHLEVDSTIVNDLERIVKGALREAAEAECERLKQTIRRCCQCRFENSKQVETCDFHGRGSATEQRDKWKARAAALQGLVDSIGPRCKKCGRLNWRVSTTARHAREAEPTVEGGKCKLCRETPTPEPPAVRLRIDHWPFCPSRDNDASTRILGKQACNSRNCDHAAVVRLVEAARDWKRHPDAGAARLFWKTLAALDKGSDDDARRAIQE